MASLHVALKMGVDAAICTYTVKYCVAWHPGTILGPRDRLDQGSARSAAKTWNVVGSAFQAQLQNNLETS